MTAPVLAGDANQWGVALQLYLTQVDDRLAVLETPQGPTPAWSCLKAALPDATKYRNAVAYVTDTKILVVSDGVVWRRQDTGAPI